jgi:hypothetical protein
MPKLEGTATKRPGPLEPTPVLQYLPVSALFLIASNSPCEMAP